MAVQDVLKGKNNTYKNGIVMFHKGGIESKDTFIPFASITRVYLGNLPPTVSISKKAILGMLIAFVGLILLFSIGKWWGILLGIIAIIGGIYIMLNSRQSVSWYALNIDMASGATYSFIANKEEYIKETYKYLLIAINEQQGGITIDLSNGKTTNINNGNNFGIIGNNNNENTINNAEG
ncbi:hypothetical protein FACS18945_3070 [Bacteroidia bacterium]|nr:hypothetical protein FACS18945_3070 [Bacteroidia bacterium]